MAKAVKGGLKAASRQTPVATTICAILSIKAPIPLGVVLGAGLALLTTRVLSSFVFGITPTDPATMFAGCFTVLAAAVIACAVPARRAARLDPNASLRCE